MGHLRGEIKSHFKGVIQKRKIFFNVAKVHSLILETRLHWRMNLVPSWNTWMLLNKVLLHLLYNQSSKGHLNVKQMNSKRILQKEDNSKWLQNGCEISWKTIWNGLIMTLLPQIVVLWNNLINMKDLCELGFRGSFHFSTQMMMVLKGCWHPSRAMFLFLKTLTSWNFLFVWGLDCVGECDGKMLWKGEEYGIIKVPY